MCEASEKVFAERQLGAYQCLHEVVARFHGLDLGEVTPYQEFLNEALSLISWFQKGYPFLDHGTIHVFNEKICAPILKFERDGCLDTDVLYDELRIGLTEHVLPTAKEFLNKEYGRPFEN